eukprot:CAMPEP_0194524384 /NCGR_PEP_ID=MMETSP0253-20130528/59550_1 /TAXON_ID=2966 /ORGANISM="Noctiluca scintillans" /LENGTH=127 /DNA_ID=CAMNT_0039369005 /DNA_START=75 /DNA_END=456 /DNA_ORIENTATION=+
MRRGRGPELNGTSNCKKNGAGQKKCVQRQVLLNVVKRLRLSDDLESCSASTDATLASSSAKDGGAVSNVGSLVNFISRPTSAVDIPLETVNGAGDTNNVCTVRMASIAPMANIKTDNKEDRTTRVIK